MGIVWGFFRHRMICEKHAIVRQKEHKEKIEEAEKQREFRKQEGTRSLYDIYLVWLFLLLFMQSYFNRNWCRNVDSGVDFQTI